MLSGLSWPYAARVEDAIRMPIRVRVMMSRIRLNRHVFSADRLFGHKNKNLRRYVGMILITASGVILVTIRHKMTEYRHPDERRIFKDADADARAPASACASASINMRLLLFITLS